MYMDYAKFNEIMNVTADVFSSWDENMKDFTNVAREGMPKSLSFADAQSLVSVRKSSSLSRLRLRITNCTSVSSTSERSAARTSSCVL